jgi:Ni/Fe-hydrogenase subunit HybB-like protein
MTPTLRERLAQRSVTGRYELFLGVGAGLAILGLILFVRSLLAGPAVADRAWHLFHVNWIYFTGLSAGGVAFAAVHKVTNAKWSGMVVRFAEALVAFLPISLLGLILIFTAGYDSIYGPMQGALHELQHSKAVWLSHDFMFARLGLGLLALTIVGWKLVWADMKPDMYAVQRWAPDERRLRFERWSRGYDPSSAGVASHDDRIHRLAPIYVVLYAYVLTLMAFDGIMALQPHWFSNLLGGFIFMGAFLGAHMLLALLMIFGSRHLGVADLVSPKQRHDLGKLCFGFTVFWTYLMWAQFLVIWYGNLPEETGFVFARLWGHWLPVGVAVGWGMFLIPFFGLLGVRPKKSKVTLGFFATVSLVALWLERYLLVMPSVTALPGPELGNPELGPTLIFLGLFLLTYAVFGRTFPMLSPRLAEITLDRERGHATAAAEFDHEEGPGDYVPDALLERRSRPR